MNIMLLESGAIVTLLVINGLFSMSEMAVVSARKSKLQQMAENKHKGALEALTLAESPNHFLSTIQIGITLVGVLSGVFGGATLSKELGLYFSLQFHLSREVADTIGVGIVVALITFLSVVVGELVPKQLALRFPERIAALAARPMNIITKISLPVVWVFSVTTSGILSILRMNERRGESAITHEEIKAMVEQGAQEGLIENEERMMMDRVLSLSKKRVTSIMTQARDIAWIDSAKPIESQLSLVLDSHFSQYPVCVGSLDSLQGTLLAKDLCRLIANKESDVAPLLFQPLYVPETSSALQILELFKKTGLQVGFVIDEFGAIQGLVTFTNILEAIVGDIPTFGLPEDLPIMRREDGSWLVDGSLPIDDLKKSLQMAALDGEGENLFQTVAGFVLHKLGRLPIQTDAFCWQNWRFEVVDMDRNRIDKVLISKRS